MSDVHYPVAVHGPDRYSATQYRCICGLTWPCQAKDDGE